MKLTELPQVARERGLNASTPKANPGDRINDLQQIQGGQQIRKKNLLASLNLLEKIRTSKSDVRLQP